MDIPAKLHPVLLKQRFRRGRDPSAPPLLPTAPPGQTESLLFWDMPYPQACLEAKAGIGFPFLLEL